MKRKILLWFVTIICLIFSPMSFAESVVPNNLVAENNSLNYDMEPSSEYAPNQLYEYVLLRGISTTEPFHKKQKAQPCAFCFFI